MSERSDLASIQMRLRRFRDEREWGQFHSPANLASAISVEAAELLEAFLWTAGGDGGTPEEQRGQIEEELADVMIQCLNFADAAGVDLLAAIEAKIDLNHERYPVDKSRGSVTKYTDL